VRKPDMRSLKLWILGLLLPRRMRYFHVGKAGADRIEAGLATLIRTRRGRSSYLYLSGTIDQQWDEAVPETPFFWGRWFPGSDSIDSAPMQREIDELEAFIMIRRASGVKSL
jgi:hypothetical protein